MDTKPRKATRKRRSTETKANRTQSHVNQEFALIRDFHFLNPFLRGLTSIGKEPQAKLFTDLVASITAYANLCDNFSLWDTQYSVDKQQLKKNLKSLEIIRTEIEAILNKLVPKYDTSKKEDLYLRLCRRSPEGLVRNIELMVKAMEPYVTKPYKIEDIRTFYIDCFKKKFPKKIKIHSSSKSEIALSIIADGVGCRYRTLAEIYYSIPIKKRKEIADPL